MPKRMLNEPSQVHVTIIAEDTLFDGTLNSESDIRINGTLEGEMNVSGKVIVSDTGRISGTLSAEAAVIAGTVTGDIVIAQKLSLTESAHVEGSIQTDRLVVEEGAVFEGDCVMQNRSKPAASAPKKNSGPVAVEPTQRAAA